MKLYILNENCVRGGYEADTARSYDECSDVTVYEGMPTELLDLAALRELHARTGGGGAFDRLVARTIREAVYAEPAVDPVAAIERRSHQ